MSEFISIKKGLTIHLHGEAEQKISAPALSDTYALHPGDFKNIIPRLLVREGEEVLAGTPLFSDKKNESVLFSSPVSGEVAEIVRGEKRKILSIRILADKDITFKPFTVARPEDLSRDQIIQALLQSGAWPFLRQRPFGVIANPSVQPKSIFISAFDTNPLAPDIPFTLKGKLQEFQTGLSVLKKLTPGNIHLNIHESGDPAFFDTFHDVTVNRFKGPHPSGNVGVQIHHIDPVNKGETVWCVNAQDVVIIGRLFNKGIFDTSRITALTGAQVKHPQYFETRLGCTLRSLLDIAGLKEGPSRFISGNVLTGRKTEPGDHIGFYDTQVTVIPESHEPEFMGWLKPGFEKFSVSRTFFSWLNPNRKFNLNTLMHGEVRPFVMTGEYEKVFPMDIHPVHLLKSILVEDLEQMENLGIYEVVEEDFALCEFICTSKIESQDIIRKGLELVQKELG